MKKQILFSLPYPSTSAISDPLIIDRDDGLVLSMTCDVERQNKSVAVIFTKPRAFRKRAEIYCTRWQTQDAYDAVCEIHQSDWVDELQNVATPEWRKYWVMRHFMIYVDSFGCLEVIAESSLLQDSTLKNSAGT
jgi:hypothetical protein